MPCSSVSSNSRIYMTCFLIYMCCAQKVIFFKLKSHLQEDNNSHKQNKHFWSDSPPPYPQKRAYIILRRSLISDSVSTLLSLSHLDLVLTSTNFMGTKSRPGLSLKLSLRITIRKFQSWSQTTRKLRVSKLGHLVPYIIHTYIITTKFFETKS